MNVFYVCLWECMVTHFLKFMLCLYVCMYVCMYAYLRCMYECMYVCVHAWYVCMHVWRCPWSYVCMYVCMYCMYVLYVCVYCLYLRMYIYTDHKPQTYIHAYIQYIHTYIHVHTYYTFRSTFPLGCIARLCYNFFVIYSSKYRSTSNISSFLSATLIIVSRFYAVILFISKSHKLYRDNFFN